MEGSRKLRRRRSKQERKRARKRKRKKPVKERINDLFNSTVADLGDVEIKGVKIQISNPNSKRLFYLGSEDLKTFWENNNLSIIRHTQPPLLSQEWPPLPAISSPSKRS